MLPVRLLCAEPCGLPAAVGNGTLLCSLSYSGSVPTGSRAAWNATPASRSPTRLPLATMARFRPSCSAEVLIGIAPGSGLVCTTVGLCLLWLSAACSALPGLPACDAPLWPENADRLRAWPAPRRPLLPELPRRLQAPGRRFTALQPRPLRRHGAMRVYAVALVVHQRNRNPLACFAGMQLYCPGLDVANALPGPGMHTYSEFGVQVRLES
jgi:hypothetical protein